jgi:hypothetical protein
MDKTRIRRGALELKFKVKNIWDDPEQDGSVMYWKTSERMETVGKNQEGNIVGRKKRLQTIHLLTGRNVLIYFIV